MLFNYSISLVDADGKRTPLDMGIIDSDDFCDYPHEAYLATDMHVFVEGAAHSTVAVFIIGDADDGPHMEAVFPVRLKRWGRSEMIAKWLDASMSLAIEA